MLLSIERDMRPLSRKRQPVRHRARRGRSAFGKSHLPRTLQDSGYWRIEAIVDAYRQDRGIGDDLVPLDVAEMFHPKHQADDSHVRFAGAVRCSASESRMPERTPGSTPPEQSNQDRCCHRREIRLRVPEDAADYLQIHQRQQGNDDRHRQSSLRQVGCHHAHHRIAVPKHQIAFQHPSYRRWHPDSR